jgi:hypothetical protein
MGNDESLYDKLRKLSPREWGSYLYGNFPPEPAPLPRLVIAATYQEYAAWCLRTNTRPHGPQRQAMFVILPEQLAGIDNLAERLVVLSWPRGERGAAMHEQVEVRLQIERERHTAE